MRVNSRTRTPVVEFNQSIKAHDAKASSRYLDRCLPCDGRTIDACPLQHRAMVIDDIDWPLHSLMLSFHDLRSLPLTSDLASKSCILRGRVASHNTGLNSCRCWNEFYAAVFRPRHFRVTCKKDSDEIQRVRQKKSQRSLRTLSPVTPCL